MRTAVTLSIITLLLAGCTGIPADAAGHRDTVTVQVTVIDAETGETLVQDLQRTFALGSGGSGLGFDFEHTLTGARIDDQFVIHVQGDDSLGSAATRTREVLFENPLVNDIGRSDFVNLLGNATVGETYSPPGAPYSLTVVAADETTVTYQWVIEDGQRDPYPLLNAEILTRSYPEEGVFTQEIVWQPGARFTVRPPSQFQPGTPLDLPAGDYVYRSTVDGVATFTASVAALDAVVGHDHVRIEARVTAIVQAPPQVSEPVDGNYGVRDSPVIKGRPSAEPDFGPLGVLG